MTNLGVVVDKAKFKGITGFLDMLWILLAGFGAMFIIAYLLIQPPAKTADVIKRADYIIVLEWDPNSTDDIDLWVQDPNGAIVSFRNKSNGLMHLEKDDLGATNDTFVDEYGNRTTLKINREIVTIRGVVPGDYQVMIHIYSRTYEEGGVKSHESPFSVEVIKIDPYDIKVRVEGKYTLKGSEIGIVRFTVNSAADFITYNNHVTSFIGANLIRTTTPNPNRNVSLSSYEEGITR